MKNQSVISKQSLFWSPGRGRNRQELCVIQKAGCQTKARPGLEAYRSHRSLHLLWRWAETVVPESLGVYSFVLNLKCFLLMEYFMMDIVNYSKEIF